MSPAKIGVYVCHCGSNIAGKVDVAEVARFAGKLPGVVVARDYKFMCSDPGQDLIRQDITKLGLDRVVVASCSPLMHEPTFRATCESAGLNRYLFEMANIREHCSWVTLDPAAATGKAKALVAGAVAKAAQLEPLSRTRVKANQNAVVVGAGIAGIQAALDLAEAGRTVYLVERETSIGGHMAAFDKTFPTLDCAACILTPKMVQAGKHPNIKLITGAQVEKLEGFVGNYKVTVKQKARYVDTAKCTGCGSCAEVCPVEVPSAFEQGLATRKAIYRNFPQAVPTAFAIDHPKTPDCMLACPIEQDVQGYVTLIRQGKFKEAHELIRRVNPLPSICAAVCNKACEGSCHRKYVDDPIAIRALKKFALERVPWDAVDLPARTPTGKRILVVEAGPAGVAAAHDLAVKGHQVTLRETGAEPLGSLTKEFDPTKLPRYALGMDIDYLKRLGVELVLSCPPLAPDFRPALSGYDAIFYDTAEQGGAPAGEAWAVDGGKPVDLTPVAVGKKRIKASRGGAAVLQRILDGKRAAQAIHNYLTGRPAYERLAEHEPPAKPSEDERAALTRGHARAERTEPAGEAHWTDAMARHEAGRCISCGVCSGCRECSKVCEAKAIDYDMADAHLELDAGAVILATGFQAFDGARIPQYGYGKLDNVVSAMEFERLSNSAGPTGGKIALADGSPPKSIALIHCVGSRDRHYNRHCSRVCCMYALKFAHLAKEKTGAEVYSFYIDMRCFGKGYEEFYDRLLDEGVQFIRGRAASISDFAQSEAEQGKLIVTAEDTLLGEVRRVPVDMAILCNGLEPDASAASLARTLHISRSADGFFLEKHPKLAPVATPTDGIYLAGACQGPKDIPDSVAQASAAAGQALSLLAKGEIELEAATCHVDPAKCAGCRICNTLCPVGAISFDAAAGMTVINEVLCKGCGTCAAACPSAAITARHFTDAQLMAEIAGALYDLRA